MWLQGIVDPQQAAWQSTCASTNYNTLKRGRYKICSTEELIIRGTICGGDPSQFVTELHILLNPIEFNRNEILILSSMDFIE